MSIQKFLDELDIHSPVYRILVVITVILAVFSLHLSHTVFSSETGHSVTDLVSAREEVVISSVGG